MTARLGIIGSSGGSVLAAADACIAAAGHQVEWVVVTDRDCGVGRWARESGHESHHIDFDGSGNFSEHACRVLRQAGCRDVLLFYTRRVTAPLIDELDVWNIHPSLLPAFPGLDGIDGALATRVRLFGATLHRVDAGLDSGPVAAQVAMALPVAATDQRAQRLGYLMKVWLTLVWFERMTHPPATEIESMACLEGRALASPGLSNPALNASFARWAEQAGGAP